MSTKRPVQINERSIGPQVVIDLPRASIDVVLRYSKYLNLKERALLNAVYLNGVSATAVARFLGQSPRRISRRIKRAVDRIQSQAFHYVVHCHEQWPVDRQLIARVVILHGQGVRLASKQLGLSLYKVRSEINRIQAEARAVQKMQKLYREHRLAMGAPDETEFAMSSH